ncbi:hypothetical protein STCU_03994 [Strigomonas culicis]|uniref:Transmembrane protein n=1 Tax=Strigomonas culicis TaxID=28005 RepID=S9TWZ7_9TRYP|nr:hypothetical protein STCU_08704 [Strigomonas culicis]EPY27539.1 hypothetical protein STCU_05700 [Strigomonas culicis]EPY30583.1 hypothetical protein STCU_03994 [Strigomonas culicis]|eukprot:EPY21089.1 hypothetical protein STCU_08704 [Strigomonas culicis]
MPTLPSCDNKPLHKRNWRLYYLLDLIAPVTAKQIKWNFRKVTLRHHYYQAYLVLYSKSRKFLYDVTGEDGYGFISSGTWGPFVNMCGAKGATVFYCLFMIFQMIMLLLFFAFLGARIDRRVGWNWQHVATPLIVFGIAALALSAFAIIVNFLTRRTYAEGMSVLDRLSPIGNCLAAVFYFCLPIVVGYRIRDDPLSQVGKFTTYMSMPIMGDILYYATSLIWRWPRRIRLQMKVDDNEPFPAICYGVFVMGFLNMGVGVAQWACIGQKLDGHIKSSWYLVFIPFIVRCVLRIAEAWMRSMMKYTVGVRTSMGVAFDTIGSFFVNGILLVSLYFVAVRIERGQAKVRLGRALIPVYVVLTYIILALIFTLVYVVRQVERKRAIEAQINGSWTPPPERAEGAGNETGSASHPSGPIRSVSKASQGGWNGLDTQSASSAAAVEGQPGVRRAPPVTADEPLYGSDGEYEVFYTDEEDDLFPEEESTETSSRSDMEPYGNRQEDEAPGTSSSSQHPRRSIPASHLSAGGPPRSAPARSAGTASEATPRSRRRAPSHGEDDTDGSYYSYTEQTTYIDEESDEGSYTDETSYLDEEYEEGRTSVTASSEFASTAQSSPR